MGTRPRKPTDMLHMAALVLLLAALALYADIRLRQHYEGQVPQTVKDSQRTLRGL